jgi:hypothetical protein
MRRNPRVLVILLLVALAIAALPLIAGASPITAQSLENGNSNGSEPETPVSGPVQSGPIAITNLMRSDVNDDCVVDLLDLALVAASYNARPPFPHAQADVNGDGVINLLDLVAVASSYGWRCPSGIVLVSPSCSQFDAPGDDNANLTEEYVCFRNADGSPADITRWHVTDRHGGVYIFPPFTLAGGASVRLHTGIGVSSATDLYWGKGAAVWTNGYDTVYLYDQDWVLVDTYPIP